MTSLAQEIIYRVTIENPQTHYANVEIEVKNCNSNETHIKMPVWTPGSYMVREFSRNVESFEVYDNKGNKMPWQKDRKNAWLVKNGKNKNYVVRYSVYANEVTVRTSFINSETAFLLGTSLLMSVEGYEKTEGKIIVTAPKKWKSIASGLGEIKGEPFSFSFSDYDELADCPIQIGDFDTLQFDVHGIPHYVAMVGANNAEKKILKRDMQRICNSAYDVVDKSDMKKYWFFVQHVDNAGGGLEHRNSVSVGMSPNNYSDSVKYKGFLGLVAHEYFHVWNVKRIRPIELGPFDYDNEVYTRMLWVAEGFTTYYDKLLPYRAGFLNQEEFLGRISSMISYSENTPGAKYQSIAESSFDAWIKAYRPDENSINSSISYYTKGSLAGALLDLIIIKATNGQKNLDDLFKYLYNEYYLNKRRGYTETEFKQASEMIAGISLDSYFQQIVYGTSSFDYTTLFASFGIDYSATPSSDPYIGLVVSKKGNKTVISSILRDSKSSLSGLDAGDVIVSINELEPTENFSEFLKSFPSNKSLTIKVNRDGKELEFKTEIERNPNNVFKLTPSAQLNPSQQKLFDKWLFR
ncbi:MAG: M61 family metallopeptidase [Bacteroidetes bacterium]|nr:M61 family metallopeptidase [Bacteroidota bacterium]